MSTSIIRNENARKRHRVQLTLNVNTDTLIQTWVSVRDRRATAEEQKQEVNKCRIVKTMQSVDFKHGKHDKN